VAAAAPGACAYTGLAKLDLRAASPEAAVAGRLEHGACWFGGEASFVPRSADPAGLQGACQYPASSLARSRACALTCSLLPVGNVSRTCAEPSHVWRPYGCMHSGLETGAVSLLPVLQRAPRKQNAANACVGTLVQAGPENPRLTLAPGEDDGFLVTYVTHAGRGASELRIYDAASMADEPVAAVALPQRVPLGFHGLHVGEADFQSQFPFDIHFMPDL